MAQGTQPNTQPQPLEEYAIALHLTKVEAIVLHELLRSNVSGGDHYAVRKATDSIQNVLAQNGTPASRENLFELDHEDETLLALYLTEGDILHYTRPEEPF